MTDTLSLEQKPNTLPMGVPRIYKALFSIAMIAVLITACGSETSSSLPEPTATIESPSLQTPAAVPTEIPNSLGEVNIYRDAKAGFALNYPAAWFIEDRAAQDTSGSIAYTVSLFSWDRDSYTPPSKDLNALPDGATKIDITVFNQGPGTLKAIALTLHAE